MSDIILWDQLDTNFDPPVVSQIWDTKPPLTSFVADSFQIGPNTLWTINQVIAKGFYNTASIANMFTINFYGPSGNPNIPTEDPLISIPDVTVNQVGDEFTFDLSMSPPVLPTGRYWISIQAQLDSNFDVTLALFPVWLWRQIVNPPDNTFVPSVFKNPGNGFFLNAVVWTDLLSVAPQLTSDKQNYRLLGTINVIPPPCLHPSTLVDTIYGCKEIKDIKANEIVIDYRGLPVKVVYNILFRPKTDEFVIIPKDSIEQNMPKKNLLIRKLHPILYKGKEVLPLKLAAKLNKTHLIKEIKIDNSTDVYSLCTKKRTFINMQNLYVATWEQDDWENKSNQKFPGTWQKL